MVQNIINYYELLINIKGNWAPFEKKISRVPPLFALHMINLIAFRARTLGVREPTLQFIWVDREYRKHVYTFEGDVSLEI